MQHKMNILYNIKIVLVEFLCVAGIHTERIHAVSCNISLGFQSRLSTACESENKILMKKLKLNLKNI